MFSPNTYGFMFNQLKIYCDKIDEIIKKENPTNDEIQYFVNYYIYYLVNKFLTQVDFITYHMKHTNQILINKNSDIGIGDISSNRFFDKYIILSDLIRYKQYEKKIKYMLDHINYEKKILDTRDIRKYFSGSKDYILNLRYIELRKIAHVFYCIFDKAEKIINFSGEPSPIFLDNILKTFKAKDFIHHNMFYFHYLTYLIQYKINKIPIMKYYSIDQSIQKIFLRQCNFLYLTKKIKGTYIAYYYYNNKNEIDIFIEDLIKIIKNNIDYENYIINITKMLNDIGEKFKIDISDLSFNLSHIHTTTTENNIILYDIRNIHNILFTINATEILIYKYYIAKHGNISVETILKFIDQSNITLKHIICNKYLSIIDNKRKMNLLNNTGIKKRKFNENIKNDKIIENVENVENDKNIENVENDKNIKNVENVENDKQDIFNAELKKIENEIIEEMKKMESLE